MIKIRRNVFETNSSSTHSICITRQKLLEELPDSVDFKLGQFGWEPKIYTQTKDKASYLYTAICQIGEYNKTFPKKQYIDNIVKFLDKNNVKYDFEDPKSVSSFYIDHVSELDEFVRLVCHSEKRLLKYLFSENSFIITGNDNDDSDVGIGVNYEHEEYYKGN